MECPEVIESFVLRLVRKTEAVEGEAGQDFLVPEPEGLSQLGFNSQNLRLAPASSLKAGWIF